MNFYPSCFVKRETKKFSSSYSVKNHPFCFVKRDFFLKNHPSCFLKNHPSCFLKNHPYYFVKKKTKRFSSSYSVKNHPFCSVKRDFFLKNHPSCFLKNHPSCFCFVKRETKISSFSYSVKNYPFFSHPSFLFLRGVYLVSLVSFVSLVSLVSLVKKRKCLYSYLQVKNKIERVSLSNFCEKRNHLKRDFHFFYPYTPYLLHRLPLPVKRCQVQVMLKL